ncbi:MAG TPA: peptide ABC transporter permease [Lichenihabitans sp.]|jgi:hypothetical protein|nr:peptide ABC transporter permease [Lichenihabitans sp.]
MPPSSRRPFDDPATDAALLLSRVGLVVLAFAVPISLVVSRRAVFTLFPVGAGLLIVSATLLPRPPAMIRLMAGLQSLMGLAGLWLLSWSALSLLWTPFPQDAAERLFREAGTVLFVVATVALLPERTRTSNLYLFPLGLTLAALATFAAAILGPQALGAFQNADSTLERAVFSLVMLVWPAIGALAVRDRWASAGWLAVGVTLAAMAAWTSVALVALAFGALVFALATLSPGRVGTALGILVGALILLGPALPLVFDPVLAGLADTLGDRLPALVDASQSVHVWATLVAGEPLRLVTGHGLDMATRAIQVGFLPAATPGSLLFEVWYELGVVGAVASAVLVGGAMMAAGRSSPTVAPFLLAEIVTGLVILVWGLESSQLWWITLVSVVAVAFANVIHGQYRTARPSAQFVRLADPPMR